MKMANWISFFLLFSVSLSSGASVDVGAGISSVTSGQYVPGITTAWIGDGITVSGSSVGFQTNIYYQSTYSLGIYKTWEPGNFLWGRLDAGFGGGVAWSQRGYAANPGGAVSSGNDLNIGPAFRITWFFLDPAYVNLESLFGLGLGIFSLAGQDVVMLSFGVRL